MGRWTSESMSSLSQPVSFRYPFAFRRPGRSSTSSNLSHHTTLRGRLADVLPLDTLQAQIALDPVHTRVAGHEAIAVLQSRPNPRTCLCRAGALKARSSHRCRAGTAPLLPSPWRSRPAWCARGQSARPMRGRAAWSLRRRRCMNRTARMQARATCLRP